MTNRPRSPDRHTLGDLDATDDRLEIKCDRCDRYGRYATRRLIAKYGRDIALPDLLNELTVGCDHLGPGIYDRCRAYYLRPLSRRPR